MKKPIVCVHGLQGSGKTYLIRHIEKVLDERSLSRKYINIKSTFAPIVDMVQKHYESLGYDLSESQRKQLMLAQSTYGEMHIDKTIWTKIWMNSVSNSPDDIILVDDIRTEFNLDGLIEIAKDRPVILFKMDVSEDIRRKRLKDNWRDNGGYTEKLLDRPEDLPSNFEWMEIDENWDLLEFVSILGKYL